MVFLTFLFQGLFPTKSTLVLHVYAYKAKPLLPVRVPEFIPTLHCKLTISQTSFQNILLSNFGSRGCSLLVSGVHPFDAVVVSPATQRCMPL